MQSSITLALVLVAVAVAIPSESVPEDALEQYVSDSDYEHARKTVQSLMQTGKADKECRDLATSSKKAIEDDVKADQKILDALPTGDSCKNEGQGLATSSQKSLAQANSDEDDAKNKLDKAKAANIDFGTIPYNQLQPGQCGTFFNHANYKKAVDIQKKAEAALAKAQGSHTAAQKAYDQAVASAADAKMKCLCRAKKASDKGWKEVKATKANTGLDWKTSHNVMCVLDGTPASKCKVPPQPTVNAPKLNAEAAKMNGSTCKDGLCYKPDVRKLVFNGNGGTANCGKHSCGQFVGPTNFRLNTLGYTMYPSKNMNDPFRQNDEQCAKVYGTGAHWCSPQEMEGFTKNSFKLLNKMMKTMYSSSAPQNLAGACGKWKPRCGMGGNGPVSASMGCWYFTCSNTYGGESWSPPLRIACQGGTTLCCKGKSAAP